MNMKTNKLLLCLTLCAAMAQAQNRKYVMENATGNGSDWGSSSASGSLQKMINESSAGDTIFVAGGTYYPDSVYRPSGGSNTRDSAFVLKSGVHIYGVFEGVTGETIDSRTKDTVSGVFMSGQTHKTILSGNDNFYHVVVGDGVSNATLDGFTITGGKADGVNAQRDGGGIYLTNASTGITAWFNFMGSLKSAIPANQHMCPMDITRPASPSQGLSPIPIRGSSTLPIPPPSTTPPLTATTACSPSAPQSKRATML
jgi:hypothetical protein